MNIANRDARQYVEALQEFKGNHLYSTIKKVDETGKPTLYVVYSYGSYWPLYIYRDGIWYENESLFSCMTTRHRGLARPDAVTIKIPVTEMLEKLK